MGQQLDPVLSLRDEHWVSKTDQSAGAAQHEGVWHVLHGRQHRRHTTAISTKYCGPDMTAAAAAAVRREESDQKLISGSKVLELRTLNTNVRYKAEQYVRLFCRVWGSSCSCTGLCTQAATDSVRCWWVCLQVHTVRGAVAYKDTDDIL
jgi:hypothetical protein